jgi:exosome complex RNA-binding protein Rrp4
MLVNGIIWVNKMNDLAGAHRWIVFISCAMESTQSIIDTKNKA